MVTIVVITTKVWSIPIVKVLIVGFNLVNIGKKSQNFLVVGQTPVKKSQSS